MRSVLIIDDHPGIGQALALLLSLRDIETEVVTSPEAGLALLARRSFGLVIQDMNFTADTTSGEEGVTLFRAIRARWPDLPVILLTAWTRLEAAVALVKAGAADYLAKPWDDARLLATVENLLELGEVSREVARLHEARRARLAGLQRRFDLAGVVFGSDATAALLELAGQIAAAPVPVLITGPNGSGKERIAAFVHANSSARTGEFVALNCGALPADLIEAELFGADSGAYTGAAKARIGRFEAADGGTLFLDEIANLPLAGQVKLLRVLETGAFERLGSSKTRTAKVRVLSATNADLRAMVKLGSFREDLFYRLNLIELKLPLLAERRDDVLPLAEHFLAGRACLSEGAQNALLAHRWPGNVRELKNVIERAVLLHGGAEITPALLGLEEASPSHRNLDEPSREAVNEALAAAGGVVSRAATALGL